MCVFGIMQVPLRDTRMLVVLSIGAEYNTEATTISDPTEKPETPAPANGKLEVLVCHVELMLVGNATLQNDIAEENCSQNDDYLVTCEENYLVDLKVALNMCRYREFDIDTKPCIPELL